MLTRIKLFFSRWAAKRQAKKRIAIMKKLDPFIYD